jgi:hypothetical protein
MLGGGYRVGDWGMVEMGGERGLAGKGEGGLEVLRHLEFSFLSSTHPSMLGSVSDGWDIPLLTSNPCI